MLINISKHTWFDPCSVHCDWCIKSRPNKEKIHHFSRTGLGEVRITEKWTGTAYFLRLRLTNHTIAKDWLININEVV